MTVQLKINSRYSLVMKTSFTSSVLAVVALATFSMVSPSFGEQTHMDAAIGYLQQAKEQLQQAEHDKGGWRVQAIKDINQVIADIQKGKAAAK